jgi:hypothetical protein
MRTEFLIKTQKGLIDLTEFKNEMNETIRSHVAGDFRMVDDALVEVFYKRNKQAKTTPPLKSLGKLPARDVLRKFY